MFEVIWKIAVQKKKAATEIVKTQLKFLPSQGYTSYGNPTMLAAQALDARKGTALNARDGASDAARFKSNSYSGNCYGNSYGGTYSTNCNARKNSPYGNDLGTAMAIGIMEGLARGMAGKQAAEREPKSCMAHYGWRKS